MNDNELQTILERWQYPSPYNEEWTFTLVRDLKSIGAELKEARGLLKVVSKLDRNEGDWWREYCEQVREFLGVEDGK